MTLHLDFLDADDVRVAPIWRALEARASVSYFLSWGWIETWLACLPRDVRPPLALVREGDAPIAACFLGERHIVRHHLVPSHARYLNATGVPHIDELTIEHNGLIRAEGTALPLSALVELLPRDWDELVLPGIDASELASLAASPERVRVDREVAAPFVDLARVRASEGGYVALLGADTRSQLRRARRGVGALRVERAEDLDQARDIYEELVALHTTSWRARGEPGAFADNWFDQFHRRLIEQRFASGEIELLRLSAGGRTLGCVYNFVYQGRVVFYQSGLASEEDPRIKPGMLCQAEAIERAARAGHAIYDFLGGDSRYKRSLATDAGVIAWATVQRDRMRFAIEDRLKGWKRRLVGRV